MGSWYTDKDNRNFSVLSTRIRLARNLSGMPFPYKMTDADREQLKIKVKNAVKNSNSPLISNLKYIDMADVPDAKIKAMVERHVISPEFATFKNSAIILSDDESISIMVGEEDHIRIQVVLAGLQLEKAYEIAEQIDRILNNSLVFAYDSELGFLTECPTNLGTGLRASVMMHLPLLESTGKLNSLCENIGKIGFTVRGIYGEGSKSIASLYQISNHITLGISEKNAIDNLSLIATQLTEKERQTEDEIDRISLEDKIFRAMGILQNCRILASNEMMNLLSLINLGLRMGIIKEDYEPIRLIIDAKPYMLMDKYGDLSPDERDVKRAEYIREHLKPTM